MIFIKKENGLTFFKRQIFVRSRIGDGFTMIEIIIALGVFTLGIMAAFSLSLANVNKVRENTNRILAANLAREALEVVRNTRDSNWLSIDANEQCSGSLCPWDNNLRTRFIAVEYNGDIDSSPGTCNVGGVSPNQCLGNSSNFCGDDCRLYLNSNFYDHDNTGVPTNMYRAVYIQDICLDGSMNEFFLTGEFECSDYGLTQVGLQVTARVLWSEPSRTDYIDITEKFYNWKR